MLNKKLTILLSSVLLYGVVAVPLDAKAAAAPTQKIITVSTVLDLAASK